MGCGIFSKSSVRTSTSKVSIQPSMFLSKNKSKFSNSYTEVKKLGSGAFANVFLCTHKPSAQQRAVKIIHKAGLNRQQIDSDFMLKEITVLTSLDHPNIIRCYEIFEDIWKYYVAEEYCAGGELFSKIVMLKKFNEAQAAEIMRQLLSAVAYCHEKLVIHRDLKPENILLEEKEGSLRIKVADFGSSCFIDSQQRLSGCFGSAYYVAPEVLMNEYNEKCDIWSCGVIMFILLTGNPPYPGRDSKAILNMIRQSPLTITAENVPGVSKEAIQLLKNLLIVNPKYRITAQKALQDPWLMSQTESSPDLNMALEHLEAFNNSTKLKDAVHIFLASQVITQEECKALTTNFMSLDKNGDGRISKEELISKYLETINENEANTKALNIISRVDVNHNGDIDYTEFLSACMNLNNYLSKESLEQAFRMFDIDGSGFITADELKVVLGEGNSVGNNVWVDVLKQVDLNGDGVIDLKEFIALMTNENPNN